MATLARNAPIQLGVSASVGVTFSQVATVRLGAAWYAPAHFDSAFGTFQIERETLSLSGARRWTHGVFSVEAALGVSGELLPTDRGLARGVGRSARRFVGHASRGLRTLPREPRDHEPDRHHRSPWNRVVSPARSIRCSSARKLRADCPWPVVGTGQLEIELRVP